MRSSTSHARHHIDPADGRPRSLQQENPSKLPNIIAVVAAVGVVPLASALNLVIGGGWIVSAVVAVVISAILAVNALLLIGK